MRLVAAGEERGPYISSAVVLGALALLTLTVFTGTRPLETANSATLKLRTGFPLITNLLCE